MVQPPEVRLLTEANAVALKATDSIVYNGDGSVASVTEDGVMTTFAYNADGTVNTETRLGKVRTWTYDANGNPTNSTVV